MKTRFVPAAGTSRPKGEIRLYEEIGFWGTDAQSFARALEELRAAGAESLDIYINSPGGEVFAGVAIYNQIRRFPGTKTVHVDALAASIASIIALAGDHVVCASNAMIMIHDPYAGARGGAAELREIADRLDKLREVMVTTYAERTGQTPDDIRAWMAAETWMTAAEAKERGFAHEISSDAITEKALADVAAFALLDKFQKTPAPLRARIAVPPPAERRLDPDASGVTEPPAMKTIAKFLGLPEAATEAEIQAALFARDAQHTAAAALLAQILALTGKATASEALGTTQAWKLAAEQVGALNARLKELEAERVEGEVVALVDGAVKAGKLTPAQKEWALKMGRSDVAMLKGFVDSAPQVAPTASAPPAAGPTGTSLTAEELAVAKQMGVPEKDMLAAKAKASA